MAEKVWKRKKYVLLAVFVLTVYCCVIFQLQTVKRYVLWFRVCDSMEKEGSRQDARRLLEEMKCFPVCKMKQTKAPIVFENGYGQKRTFGGKRCHEGIDIIPVDAAPGEYKICSVSEGTIEKKGWLPLGGYRIGIRSQEGYYYYYAHLHDYANGMQVGKKVKPGEVIGTMGNTGYGKEGTRGKFVVHLHFGIYKEQAKKERSVNPYYLLKYLSGEDCCREE